MRCNRILLLLVLLVVTGFVLATAQSWQRRVTAQEPAAKGEEAEKSEQAGTEREEFERHYQHLEIERQEMEVGIGRLEMVIRLAEIGENRNTAASYAILHVDDYMEVEKSISFLESMMIETRDAAVLHLIRIKLAELYAQTEQGDAVKAQLRSLIIGK